MLLTKNLSEETLDYIDPFGSILASVAWTVRSSYNSATDATPAQLVFGRDMIFNISTFVNWKDLSLQKKMIIHKSNLQERKERVDHDYQVDIQVYITIDEIYKN